MSALSLVKEPDWCCQAQVFVVVSGLVSYDLRESKILRKEEQNGKGNHSLQSGRQCD